MAITRKISFSIAPISKVVMLKEGIYVFRLTRMKLTSKRTHFNLDLVK